MGMEERTEIRVCGWYALIQDQIPEPCCLQGKHPVRSLDSLQPFHWIFIFLFSSVIPPSAYLCIVSYQTAELRNTMKLRVSVVLEKKTQHFNHAMD